MNFLREIEELGRSVLSWIYSFIFFSVFIFAFGLKEVSVRGFNFLIPFPGWDSFSVIFFERIRADLLPEEIDLMVTNPLQALWAQIGISFFLAFIITLPFLLYKLMNYFLPAFTGKEKKIMLKALVPSSLLFFSGCVFAYFLLIPATINVLYIYVVNIGAIPFFSVSEFVSLVLMLVLAVGILFMLPVFMVILSLTGLVDSSFWINNWRYSVLIFLIFTAIITPDGSGVTMILLSVPLILLYLIGYVISKRITKGVAK